jgi:hypothetical protein
MLSDKTTFIFDICLIVMVISVATYIFAEETKIHRRDKLHLLLDATISHTQCISSRIERNDSCCDEFERLKERSVDVGFEWNSDLKCK